MKKKGQVFLEEALKRYKEVLVNVNTKHPGIVAPENFKSGDNPVLRIGYETPVSANLKVDENGFSADMPFSAGVISYCEVPYEAIISIAVPANIENERKPHLSVVK